MNLSGPGRPAAAPRAAAGPPHHPGRALAPSSACSARSSLRPGCSRWSGGGRTAVDLGRSCLLGRARERAAARRACASQGPACRAAWLAIGIALLAGVGLAAWLLRSCARTAHHGLMTLGAARVLLEWVCAEDPRLAGAPLGVETQVHALAALSRLSGVGVAGCAAALGLWSIVTALVTIHLHSAVLWRDGRADLAARSLALVGVGALAGFRSRVRCERRLAVALARGVGGAPGEVLHSGMVWLREVHPRGAGPGLGGLYAASHALRHGHAPLALLTGACSPLRWPGCQRSGSRSQLRCFQCSPGSDAGARRPGSWGARSFRCCRRCCTRGRSAWPALPGASSRPSRAGPPAGLHAPGRARSRGEPPRRTLLGPRADLRILLLLAVTAAVLALATGSWVAAAGGDAAGAQAAAVAPPRRPGSGLARTRRIGGREIAGAAILASVLVGAEPWLVAFDTCGSPRRSTSDSRARPAGSRPVLAG